MNKSFQQKPNSHMVLCFEFVLTSGCTSSTKKPLIQSNKQAVISRNHAEAPAMG